MNYQLSTGTSSSKESTYCVWAFDGTHDKYDTACKHAFQFTTGNVEDNEFRFCPHCGDPIATVPMLPSDEELLATVRDTDDPNVALEDWSDGPETTCGYSDQPMTLVRPGKHQCDNENCRPPQPRSDQ